MIYLDYNSTTPTCPEVLEAMLPYFKEHYGNASNNSHPFGWTAELAAKKSREQIAELISCKPTEIYFTSGATESNNLAIQGYLLKELESNPEVHWITTAIEHSSVIKQTQYWKHPQVSCTVLDVDSQGMISIDDLRKALRPHTRLISVIWANNEIGTIQKMAEIQKIAYDHQIALHSDGTQVFGKIPVSLQALPLQFFSFSGHKIYGPKGVGGLVVQQGVQLHPIVLGGGQEQGLRSGTLNIPGIVGLGKAASLAKEKMKERHQSALKIQQFLTDELTNLFPQVRFNGDPLSGSAHVLNVTFPDEMAYKMPYLNQKLALSAGAACGTATKAYSHVLKAIGVSAIEAERTVRISWGDGFDQEKAIETVKILKAWKNQ